MPEKVAAKDALYQSAQESLHQRNYEQAYQQLCELLRLDQEFADAHFLLARIAHDFQNFDKAIELLNKAITIAPENAEYLASLAKALVMRGDVTQALATVKSAAALEHQSALSLDTIGIVYNRLSLYQEASLYFQKAIALEQHNAGIYFNLASTLKFCGDFEGARNAYEKAIALNPVYYKAHAALTSLGGITLQNNHVERLKSLLPSVQNSDDALHLAHALAKEFEALDQFDQAFYYLDKAKQQKLAGIAYCFADDLLFFDALKNHFSSSDYARRGCEAGGSIFVVGMPRSGTTLVERIISCHSQVATAGELHNFGLIFKAMLGRQSNRLIDHALIESATAIDYPALGQAYIDSSRHLAKGKSFLVDKLPLNVLYAGFIIRALPHAKIICLDRNPLDTIASNFRQLFSFHDLTYAYSLSLTDTARYYLEFKRLSHFWQALFPENFYIIKYESLVKHPEQEINKLLTFCGMAWEENCLMIEKNLNPVATASSVQVRSPISDKSVGQWQQYEQYLADVKQLLVSASVTFK